MEGSEVVVIESIDRASDREPRVSDSVGTTNFYSSVASCAEHDGGVP